MKPSAPPFSRPLDVRSLPSAGVERVVAADEAERAALAREFDAPAIASLEGAYRIKPAARGQVVVKGVARARLTRLCVVSLEPFETEVEESVDVVFASAAAAPGGARASARGHVTAGRSADEATDLAALGTPDPPDPIIDGRIDLGALTAEFVALGLDPWPRRPGATFPDEMSSGPGESPFAALARRKGDPAS